MQDDPAEANVASLDQARATREARRLEGDEMTRDLEDTIARYETIIATHPDDPQVEVVKKTLAHLRVALAAARDEAR
jgi:hypothetical protein